MKPVTVAGNQFVQDGEPLQLIAGAMHYFRVVPEYWEDRLRKLRGQLPGRRPAQLQFAPQHIEGRLQICILCADGAGALILQLEAGKPGFGLQLMQATEPGPGLVKLALQSGQLLMPLLLALAGLLKLLAGPQSRFLLLGEQLLTLLQPRLFQLAS